MARPAEKLLKRLAYKPNFVFTFSKKVEGRLIITMCVERVEEPGTVGPIDYLMDYSWMDTAGQFYNVLFNHIVSMELHEAKEWFRIDGQPIFNPHPQIDDKEAA